MIEDKETGKEKGEAREGEGRSPGRRREKPGKEKGEARQGEERSPSRKLGRKREGVKNKCLGHTD